VTEYPKSDNNGSISDASTIPKDGDHLKGGPEEDGELCQIRNPQLDKALAVVKSTARSDQSQKKRKVVAKR
jgi:hypothetical protein